MKNDYIYAASRIRALGQRLFGRQELEQLLSAGSIREALKILQDRGFGKGGSGAEELLRQEEEKTWKLAEEILTDPSVLDPLKYQYDFHNLKAAVKVIQAGTKFSPERLFVSGGTLPWQKILKCAEKREFSDLPPKLAEAGEEGVKILLRTGDGQLADAVIDRHFLEPLYQAVENQREKGLKGYAAAFGGAADIRTALRAGKTGRTSAFLRQALAPVKELDIKALARAALEGRKKLAQYLEHTEFSGAGEAVLTSDLAFENWCGELISARTRCGKNDFFTAGPLVVYILEKRQEIRRVGLILTAKENKLPEKAVRERLGERYA